jgi:hypothetical protein
MTFEIVKEALELREEGTGRKWKAVRYGDYSGTQDYTVYLNGNTGFELKRDGGLWIVYNDDPHSSQYSSRKRYLSALSQGIHEKPEIGRFSVKNSPTLQDALEQAIGIFKTKGWFTLDVFSGKLTMERARKRLAA